MKAQVREWLAAAEIQHIIDTAMSQNRTVRVLITLTYDPDPLISWRALDALGRCAAHLCATRPEAMKNILRRLFWQMSDECGAIAWRAPEAIGEIVRADPLAFADFIPMTIALLDLEPEDRPPFLPGILYALGRIGEAAPDSVKNAVPKILEVLADKGAQARAMAVWCVGQIGAQASLLQHPELGQDQGNAVVYRHEQLESTTVSSLWAEAVAIIPPQ